jgi:hypothetical protein
MPLIWKNVVKNAPFGGFFLLYYACSKDTDIVHFYFLYAMNIYRIKFKAFTYHALISLIVAALVTLLVKLVWYQPHMTNSAVVYRYYF